jgi:hypothetical protein
MLFNLLISTIDNLTGHYPSLAREVFPDGTSRSSESNAYRAFVVAEPIHNKLPFSCGGLSDARMPIADNSLTTVEFGKNVAEYFPWLHSALSYVGETQIVDGKITSPSKVNARWPSRQFQICEPKSWNTLR